MYAIIQFIIGKNIELVPQSWLIEDSVCLWPPQKKGYEVSSLIKKCITPEEGWKRHAVRVLGKADFFGESKPLTKVVYESDLHSDNEDFGGGMRRKHMPPQRFNEDNGNLSDEKECSVSDIFNNIELETDGNNFELFENDQKFQTSSISQKKKGARSSKLQLSHSKGRKSNGFYRDPFEKVSKHLHYIEENSEKKVEGPVIPLLMDIKFMLREVQETQLKILEKFDRLEAENDKIADSDQEDEIILPLLPVNSVEDLQNLEHYLTDPDVKKALINKLRKIGGQNFSYIVTKIMTTLISNSLAVEYSFYGFQKKKSFFKLKNIFEVITEVVRKHIPSATDEDISKPLASWLRHAKERLKKQTMKDLSKLEKKGLNKRTKKFT